MTNQERRNIYRLYRDMGYSVKEARNMRNRPVKAWQDYFKREAYVKHIRAKLPPYSTRKPAMPKPISKRVDRKATAKRLEREFGLQPKLARQIARTSAKNIQKKIRHLKQAKETLKGMAPWGRDETKELKKAMAEAERVQDIFDVLRHESDLLKSQTDEMIEAYFAPID